MDTQRINLNLLSRWFLVVLILSFLFDPIRVAAFFLLQLNVSLVGDLNFYMKTPFNPSTRHINITNDISFVLLILTFGSPFFVAQELKKFFFTSIFYSRCLVPSRLGLPLHKACFPFMDFVVLPSAGRPFAFCWSHGFLRFSPCECFKFPIKLNRTHQLNWETSPR